MKKVYLIYPKSIYPPIGVMYLSAALKKAEIDCELLPSSISFRKLKKKLKRGISIVGMSVMTSPEIKRFVKLSQKIKKHFPVVPIIWGGVHSTINHKQCMEEDYIDYVIGGYAEKEFPKIVKDIFVQGLDPDGLDIKLNNKNINEFDLDWDSIDLKKYVFPAKHSIRPFNTKKNIFYYLHTSRGCIYNCNFCAVSCMTKEWISHSPEWVRRNICTIRKSLAKQGIYIDGIGFWDDMFFANMARVKYILKYMKDEGLGYLVEARADQLLAHGHELFKTLKDTGCMQVFVGAESMSRKTLEDINKGNKVDDYYKLVHLAENYKMPVRFSFIVGFPYETDMSVNKTLSFIEYITEENNYCSISGPKLYTPYPGTEEFRKAVMEGFKVPENTLEWASINRKTKNYLSAFPWIEKNLSKSTLKRMKKALK